MGEPGDVIRPDEEQGQNGPQEEKKVPKGGLKRSFKRRLVTGLIVTFPLVLTFYVVKLLFEIIDGIFGPTLAQLFGRPVPGPGLVIALVLVFVIGAFATTVFGQKIIEWNERRLLSIPVIKSFYLTFKQLGDAFSPKNKAAFKKFVIVEYPGRGIHSFGFLTKECVIKNDRGVEECYMTVYVPTNHLYLGEIGLFRREEVIMTDLSIEDGIRIIISAGIAAPSLITRSRQTPEQALGVWERPQS